MINRRSICAFISSYRYSVIILTFVALSWLLGWSIYAQHLSECGFPYVIDDNGTRWPRCVTVFYQIDTEFTQVERDGIEEAIAHWNQSLSNEAMEITFAPGPPIVSYFLRFERDSTAHTDGLSADTDYLGEDANGYLNSAVITIYPNSRFPSGRLVKDPADMTIDPHDPAMRRRFVTTWGKTSRHEIGHTMGIGHPIPADEDIETERGSVMNTQIGQNDEFYQAPHTIQPNDACAYKEGHGFVDSLPPACTPTPTPTPAPTPTCPPGQFKPHYKCVPGGGDFAHPDKTCQEVNTCGFDECNPNDNCGYCLEGFECPNPISYWSDDLCCCENPEDPGRCDYSPIIIDIDGDGFDLTDGRGGVDFDLDNNGSREHLSWTVVGSDDAWLALDRNNNGTIDNGSELFGNYTPQPDPPQGIVKNGFNALAEYDKWLNGGNQDGQIDWRDVFFHSLLLWQDTNHNGISEQSELHSLVNLGVARLDLDYKESKRTDQHGNRFKYRAKVKDVHGAQVGRWAWDVFLVRQ